MAAIPAKFGSMDRRLRIVGFWAVAVVFFASQWCLYDAIRGHKERWSYYLLTSAYLWGVLTPAVLWLVRRRPMDVRTWKPALGLHVLASMALTGLGVFLEAFVGWLPSAGDWPFRQALRHYFTHHT